MGVRRVRPPQKRIITTFLKPYIMKMCFTNRYVSAEVVHTPTSTLIVSASSREKTMRDSMENTRDVAAAGRIGKLLGERLLLQNIPAVEVYYEREQMYHGKVKAMVDSVRESGVKLL